jgi:hypothetical protein
MFSMSKSKYSKVMFKITKTDICQFANKKQHSNTCGNPIVYPPQLFSLHKFPVPWILFKGKIYRKPPYLGGENAGTQMLH